MQYINKATLRILNHFEHRNGLFWSAEILMGLKVICTVEQKGWGGANFYYGKTPEWKKCKQEILSLFNKQANTNREEELIDAIVTYTGHNETLEQGIQHYRSSLP